MSDPNVGEALAGAVTLGVFVGLLVGLFVGRLIWREEEPPAHRHTWSKWEDAPLTVTPTWKGVSGTPYNTDGQSKRCEGCGKVEMRTVASH